MVLAYKIISGYTIQKQFECGQFDILQESDPGNGWVEISRDCDAWLPARWSLYPYASGNNGGFFSSSNESKQNAAENENEMIGLREIVNYFYQIFRFFPIN